jgi:hypothetical protein
MLSFPPAGRVRAIAVLVVSAALVALLIELSSRAPWLGVLLALSSLALFAPRIRARRRMRQLLVSGDVEAVLAAWETALESAPHRETLLPLVRATALASNGMLDRARAALARATESPAWEAALEQRLFIETMLDAFEGDRDAALDKAERLQKLPLPPAGIMLRGRVVRTRHAVAALARAFAHRASVSDVGVLRAAARNNPLIHWPLRYAAAVACIDLGLVHDARSLLVGAPSWPAGSAFREFHAELACHARS